MDEEEWRPVVDWEGLYEVSSLGRVRSLPRPWCAGRIRVLTPDTDHYPSVVLTHSKRIKTYRVPTLVAEAFLGPRPDGAVIRHLDGVPTNNVPSNLAYGTPAENSQDEIRHGRNPQLIKTHCRNGHPYDEENTYLYQGHRRCRECGRAANREWWARKRESSVL